MMGLLRLCGAMSLAALSALACGDDGKVLGERSHSGGAASGGSGNRAGASTTGGDTAQGGSSPTGGASGASAGGTMATGGNAGTGDASGGDAGASAGDAGASGSAVGGSANGGDAGAGGGSGAGAGSGGGGGSGGSAGTPCVDRTCSDSEVCVAHRTIGGAVSPPDDAGACPPNEHEENDYCLVNYAYECVAQPGCTGGTVDCSCGTCPQPFNTCRPLYMAAWLDTDAKLICEQLAP
jgi:hypothetical protein